MLQTLAIANYRSIRNLVIPLGHLNVVTGPNGSGKSNLYRALRLLGETAQGGVVNALAQAGGCTKKYGQLFIARQEEENRITDYFFISTNRILHSVEPTFSKT